MSGGARADGGEGAPGAPDRQLTVDRLNRAVGFRLSDEQLAVVTAPLEPTLVVAGAGSGKTTVMAARVAWLVGTGQVAPEEVLGLTFTNKAAAELGARIRKLLRSTGLAGRPASEPPGFGLDQASGSGGSDGEPTVSTYHAYAARLLRENGLRIGVEPGSRLLADATRFQVATRVVARFPRPLRLQSTFLPTVVDDVLNLDAELAEHLVDPAAAREDDLRTMRAASAWLDENATAAKRELTGTVKLREAAAKRLELLDLVEALRAERARLDLLDFSDQLRLAAELVRTSDAVVDAERVQFKVVLLDEYQDTSVAQRVLLQTAFGSGHPVTAVGDPCQAIYGWRGASVHNIDAFPTDFPDRRGAPAAIHTLSVNNRSGDAVLALANELAEPLRRVHPEVAPLRPRADLVGSAQVVTALHGSHADEVAWVCDEIARQVHEQGRSPEEIAVLVRETKESTHYRDALLARGVPVEVVGLGGLLDVPEVADVVATLEVLDDATANPSMVRLLSGPRWRIGPRDLALLGRRSVELARPPLDDADGVVDDTQRLAEALSDAVAERDPAEVDSLSDALSDPGGYPYSPEARTRFAALAAELRELRRHHGEPVAETVSRIVSMSGLDVEVSARHGSDGGAALAQLVEHAAQFSDPDGESGLHAFLAFLRAARRHDAGMETPPGTVESAVRLMTAHKAKGLEFPVVFVPALSDKVFPNANPRDVWTKQAKCVPGPLRGDAADRPALGGFAAADHKAFADAVAAEHELEERRLAYVAVTRAEELLVVSGHWWGPTQAKPRGPSPYLVAARDLCVASGDPQLSVAVWTEEPTEASNPALAEGLSVPWPAPLDPDELAERRRVAQAVAERRTVHEARAAAGDDEATSVPDGLSADEAELVAGWDADAAALLTEARALARRSTDVVPVPPAMGATAALRLLRDPERVAAELARPMPRPPAPAARRGTRFHEWVEEHFARRQLELTDLAGPGTPPVSGRRGDLDDGEPGGVAADPFETSLLGDVGRVAGTDADIEGLVEAFLAGPFADRVPHLVETPFSVVLDGLVLRGRIDAVYTQPDGRWLVVDWKTGRGEPDPGQLAIYRLAWAELVGVDVDQVDAAFYDVATGAVDQPKELPDRAALTAEIAALSEPKPSAD